MITIRYDYGLYIWRPRCHRNRSIQIHNKTIEYTISVPYYGVFFFLSISSSKNSTSRLVRSVYHADGRCHWIKYVGCINMKWIWILNSIKMIRFLRLQSTLSALIGSVYVCACVRLYIHECKMRSFSTLRVD